MTVDVVNIISDGDEYELAVVVDVTFETVTTRTGHLSIENVVVVVGSNFGQNDQHPLRIFATKASFVDTLFTSNVWLTL